jgi:hypothetical protein
LFVLLAAAIYLFTGCAGPTTPLGAPWATNESETRNGPLAYISSLFKIEQAEIRFYPRRQNLHGPHPFTILIHDPAGVKSNFHLIVRHNGLEVTPSFLRQAQVTINGKDLRIHVPLVRLPADRDNLIEVIYMDSYARYESPRCNAFSRELPLVGAPGFNTDPRLLEIIRRISRLHGFSPAFTAALIAQESGFNPRTVSWAKAIGLTQVTPLAEDEIVSGNSTWPRYPGINELPALFVKALVVSGNANRSNEWRLDSELSIHGGLTFAELLARRWSAPDSLARLKQQFADPDDALTRLVLASYNSGFARVNGAQSRLGPNWLSAPELREARKYVNRITSYCDQFSEQEQGESSDEDQT